MSTIHVHRRHQVVGTSPTDLEDRLHSVKGVATATGETIFVTDYTPPVGAVSAAEVRYCLPAECESPVRPTMTWSQVKKNWNKVSEQFHRRWDRLSDLDLRAIGGRRAELIDRLRQLYSIDRAHAEKDADDFLKTLH